MAAMHDDYRDFLHRKTRLFQGAGVEIAAADLHPALFDFQRDLVRWALRKGRAALFTTTGSGKTVMQLQWAELIGERSLILAPLAVAQQTVREGQRVGIPVTYARSQGQAAPAGITVTNYEMLGHFDPRAFPAVVLDESSCLKNFSGTVKKQLVETFRQTPYRLCCTATPAPNDAVELCNHADFLGIMSPADMLSRFFITKGEEHGAHRFRLKRHARTPSFRWLASWAMAMNAPSDLGYPDAGFVLPPLSVTPRFVETDWKPEGHLFFTELKGVTSRAAARKATVAARVAAVVDLVRREPGESWLIWCGLNEEARQVAAQIPGAVNVTGSAPPAAKAAALQAFAAGDIPTLVTKLTVAGFGMNFQRCARMAFLGLGDSWEQYFQGLRRCWRFGQTRPVEAHIVLSSVEADVYNNVMRKEQEATALQRELVGAVAAYARDELAVTFGPDEYAPQTPLRLPPWLQRVAVTEEAIPA